MSPVFEVAVGPDLAGVARIVALPGRRRGTTVGPCRRANASAAMSCVCRASASCVLRNSSGVFARFFPAIPPAYEGLARRGGSPTARDVTDPGQGGPLDPHIGGWEDREGLGSSGDLPNAGLGGDTTTAVGGDGGSPREL
jgi:hypothetical protein